MNVFYNIFFFFFFSFFDFYSVGKKVQLITLKERLILIVYKTNIIKVPLSHHKLFLKQGILHLQPLKETC
jgi:hypothetical protein